VYQKTLNAISIFMYKNTLNNYNLFTTMLIAALRLMTITTQNNKTYK